MSERLDQLRAATRRRDQDYEAAVEVWGEFRAYAASVAQGLPLPWQLEAFQSLRLGPGRRRLETHIVTQEVIREGQVTRIPGDPLCKPRLTFDGVVTTVRPNDEGATCCRCIEIAERLAIAEWQRQSA